MAKLKTLQIHLSEQQVEYLDRRRGRSGIRRSEYLRRLVDADREKAEAESPPPPPGPEAVPSR